MPVLCARRHRRAKRGASGEAKPLTEDDDEEEDEEEEEEGGLPMVGTAAEVCLTAMEKRQMLCGNEREVRRLLEDSLMVPKKHCMMGFVCQCDNLLHGRTTRELQVAIPVMEDKHNYWEKSVLLKGGLQDVPATPYCIRVSPAAAATARANQVCERVPQQKANETQRVQLGERAVEALFASILESLPPEIRWVRICVLFVSPDWASGAMKAVISRHRRGLHLPRVTFFMADTREHAIAVSRIYAIQTVANALREGSLQISGLNRLPES